MATLKTIFNKAISSIGRLIKGTPKYVQDALHVAASFGDKIRAWDANHPEALDILTYVIPSKIDDKLKDEFRAKAPLFIDALNLGEELKGVTDPAQIYKTISDKVKPLGGEGLTNFMDGLGAQAVVIASKGKVAFDLAKVLMKPFYDEFVKKSAK